MSYSVSEYATAKGGASESEESEVIQYLVSACSPLSTKEFIASGRAMWARVRFEGHTPR